MAATTVRRLSTHPSRVWASTSPRSRARTSTCPSRPCSTWAWHRARAAVGGCLLLAGATAAGCTTCAIKHQPARAARPRTGHSMRHKRLAGLLLRWSNGGSASRLGRPLTTTCVSRGARRREAARVRSRRRPVAAAPPPSRGSRRGRCASSSMLTAVRPAASRRNGNACAMRRRAGLVYGSAAPQRRCGARRSGSRGRCRSTWIGAGSTALTPTACTSSTAWCLARACPR